MTTNYTQHHSNIASTLENTLAVDSRQMAYQLAPLTNFIASSVNKAIAEYFNKRLYKQADDPVEALEEFVRGNVNKSISDYSVNKSEEQLNLIANATTPESLEQNQHYDTLKTSVTTTTKGYRELSGRVKISRKPISLDKVKVGFCVDGLIIIDYALPSVSYSDGISSHNFSDGSVSHTFSFRLSPGREGGVDFKTIKKWFKSGNYCVNKEALFQVAKQEYSLRNLKEMLNGS